MNIILLIVFLSLNAVFFLFMRRPILVGVFGTMLITMTFFLVETPVIKVVMILFYGMVTYLTIRRNKE